MYQQCVVVGSCLEPTQEIGGPVYSNPEYANHPVVGVTWDQAQGYCAWALGRLPTEAEWEKGARGLVGNVYPWGADVPACDLLNFAYCSGRTSEVDAFLQGASVYGLYDRAGNVFEWVGDWYDETYYQNSPLVNPTGADSGQYRVIMERRYIIVVILVFVVLFHNLNQWLLTVSFLHIFPAVQSFLTVAKFHKLRSLGIIALQIQVLQL
jgi:formylglycine-generating enzyme required for sulfatase activity